MKNKLLVIAISLLLASGCSSNSNNPTASSGDSASTTGNGNNSSSDILNSGLNNTGVDDDSNTSGNTINEPIALEITGQDLLVSLAGFQADQLSLYIRKLAEEIASAGEPMFLPDSTFEALDGFGPEFVLVETQVTAYTCNSGRQMRHEVGRQENGCWTTC